MDVSWIASLPSGVLYSVVGLLALVIIGPLIIILLRGIKYKREKPSGEKVEIQVEGIVEPSPDPAPPAPALIPKP